MGETIEEEEVGEVTEMFREAEEDISDQCELLYLRSAVGLVRQHTQPAALTEPLCCVSCHHSGAETEKCSTRNFLTGSISWWISPGKDEDAGSWRAEVVLVPLLHTADQFRWRFPVVLETQRNLARLKWAACWQQNKARRRSTTARGGKVCVLCSPPT